MPPTLLVVLTRVSTSSSLQKVHADMVEVHLDRPLPYSIQTLMEQAKADFAVTIKVGHSFLGLQATLIQCQAPASTPPSCWGLSTISESANQELHIAFFEAFLDPLLVG